MELVYSRKTRTRSAGDSVQVLETDDGSGWVKAADGQGNSGLVPASYLAYDSSLTSAKPSETGSGQRGTLRFSL